MCKEVIQDDNGVSYKLNNKNKTAEVVESPDAHGDILIPRSIKYKSIEYLIIGIGMSAFEGNEKIQSISFPSNSEISYIESYSIQETKIKQIKIPDSVTKIGYNAFCSCENLMTIEISPNSKLTSFRVSTFVPIKNIYLPPYFKNLDEIGSLLNSFKKLESIIISPQNKNLIMNDDNILLGKSDDSIETFDAIVYANRNITHITIPSSIKIISDSSFQNCSNLQSVDFSQNSILEIISQNAFRSCVKLRSIKLPDSVKKIGKESLLDCCSLKNIILGENSNLEEIESNAFSGSSLQSFEIPKKVTSIRYQAFDSCRNLSIVKFPSNSNLSNLENNTFYQTNLRHIVIPSYIKTLDFCCFSCCNNLSSAEFLGDRLEIGARLFMCSQNLIIISFPNVTSLIIGNDPFHEGSSNCLILVNSNANIHYNENE